MKGKNAVACVEGEVASCCDAVGIAPDVRPSVVIEDYFVESAEYGCKGVEPITA